MRRFGALLLICPGDRVALVCINSMFWCLVLVVGGVVALVVAVVALVCAVVALVCVVLVAVVVVRLLPFCCYNAKPQLSRTLLSMKNWPAKQSLILVLLVLWLLLHVLQLSGALSSMYCCQRRPPKPNRKAIATAPVATTHVLASPLCARIRKENLKIAIPSFPRLHGVPRHCRDTPSHNIMSHPNLSFVWTHVFLHWLMQVWKKIQTDIMR